MTNRNVILQLEVSLAILSESDSSLQSAFPYLAEETFTYVAADELSISQNSKDSIILQ